MSRARRAGWARQRGVLGAAAALGAVVVACGDSAPRITRDRDAGAAVVVAAPVKPGAGPVGAGASAAALAGVPAPRAVTAEVEPNQAPAEATPLALGAAAKGALDSSADADVFRVEVPAATQLLIHLAGGADVDLVLEALDAGGKVLAASDRGPAKASEGLPNLPVPAGAVFVRVREFVKAPAKAGKGSKAKPGGPPPPPARAGLSTPYQLGVWDLADPALAARVTPDRERNDDLGTASELLLGEPARGLLGWSGDVDVWKLALDGLTEADALDVTLTGVDGVTPTLELLDAAGRVLATRKGAKGRGAALAGVVALRPGAAPVAHLRVRGERSHPDAPYELRVAPRALGPGDEREPNDAEADATPWPELGPLRGLATGGDVDRVALAAATSPRRLEVALGAAGDLTWRVRVVAGAATLADQRGAAGAAIAVGADLPAGEPATVILEASGATDAAVPYELALTLTALDPMPPELPAAPDPAASPGAAPAAAP